MAFINELLDQLNTYGRFRLNMPNGTVVDAIGFDVVENGVTTTVWRAEKYIFQNGSLANGISINGLSNSGGYLQAGIGADNHDSANTQCSINGIDLTNYSKMDVVLDYNAGANYGSGSVTCDIDGYWNGRALPESYDRTSTTLTFDVSSHIGTHFLGFGLYAENNSSEPTWGAWANVWIKEIRLYN